MTTPDIPGLPETYSEPEAAAALHISTDTLGRLANDGRVPHVRIGGCPRRYTAAHIAEILESFTRRPDDSSDALDRNVVAIGKKKAAAAVAPAGSWSTTRLPNPSATA